MRGLFLYLDGDSSDDENESVGKLAELAQAQADAAGFAKLLFYFDKSQAKDTHILIRHDHKTMMNQHN